MNITRPRAFTALFVIGILSVLTSHASEVSVHANRYSSTGCQYYSSSFSDLVFEIKGADVRANEWVNLVYGFRNNWNGLSWQRVEKRSVRADSRGIVRLDLGGVEVDARGSYHFSSVQFYVSSTRESGDARLSSSFEAILPELATCAAGSLEALVVQTNRD